MIRKDEMQNLKDLHLRRLADQYRGLENAIRQLDEGAWNCQPSNGKWSARQHLAHLTRYHRIFLDRLDRILSENAPRLDRYSAETDAAWLDWQSLDRAEVVRRLDSLRTDLTRRLAEIPAERFARAGIHPKFGSLALTDWLEFFLIHEGHHMYCMYRARWD